MRKEELFDIIGEVSEEKIAAAGEAFAGAAFAGEAFADAAMTANKKPRIVWFRFAAVAAACLCLVFAGILFFRSENSTKIPAIDSEESSSSSALSEQSESFALSPAESEAGDVVTEIFTLWPTEDGSAICVASSPPPVPVLPTSGDAVDIICEFSGDFELSEETTAELYMLDVPTSDAIVAKVEKALGVEDLSSHLTSADGEVGSFYYVEDKNATVSIEPDNGFWSIHVEDPTAPIVPENLPTDEEAVEIARAYIAENGLFSGDLGEPGVTHGYTGAGEDRQNTDVTVTFYPPIGGHAVYGLYRIVIIVGDNGSIQNVSMQANPVKFSQTVFLKTKEEVIAEVEETPPGELTITTEGIDKAIITDCELRYYMDGVPVDGKNYAYPVYVLSGGDGEDHFEIIIDAIQRW